MTPISFTLPHGQKIRVSGRSGSGKSTFAMGLIGALEYSGSIMIDEVELKDVAELHTVIIAELQKSHIFNTSIRENLRIANKEASDDEILKVLKIVELDSLLAESKNGIDTLIGEFGRHISGGEAKRLSLARALLSKVPIVILDEPTEHLNSDLALRIEKRVLDYTSDKTLIVITHSGWQEIDRKIELSR
jgi:ABC-type transport system involved in cytochrome bd biosynthesis fused ATPase/permease subunit